MATYQLISSATVGSGGAASIVFSSIPQTYTDLIIKLSGRTSDGGFYNNVTTSINNQTAGQWRTIYGFSSAAYSGNATIIYSPSVPASSATANIFSNAEMYFPNYTSSNVKSVSVDTPVENNSGSDYLTAMDAVNFTNGTAINTITLTANFVQYSTAYLYGISNA
jgi:hypothetical protein